MNRILRTVILFLTVAVAHGVAQNSNADILGDWQLELKGITYEISFQDGGTFKGLVSHQEKILWICAGKWTIEGSRLHYTYTESSLKSIPPGSVDEDELLRVATDFYETKNKAGETNRYNRKQKKEPIQPPQTTTGSSAPSRV